MKLLRPDGALPLVIAHRGDSRHAPENTTAAFDLAWGRGCRWIETDVQPTSDNVPVLLHDDSVDRTTDGTGAVRDLPHAHLRTLDAGHWHAAEFAGSPIPTLAELTATLNPSRDLLLEIKGEHTLDQLSATLAVTAASGWDEHILVQSFELPALRGVRRLQPDRPLGLLVDRIHDDPVTICRELGAITYNPSHRAVLDDPAVVTRLHDAGIAVLVWTADDADEWARLDRIGVNGIITNTPGDLIAWLARDALEARV